MSRHNTIDQLREDYMEEDINERYDQLAEHNRQQEAEWHRQMEEEHAAWEGHLRLTQLREDPGYEDWWALRFNITPGLREDPGAPFVASKQPAADPERENFYIDQHHDRMSLMADPWDELENCGRPEISEERSEGFPGVPLFV